MTRTFKSHTEHCVGKERHSREGVPNICLIFIYEVNLDVNMRNSSNLSLHHQK